MRSNHVNREVLPEDHPPHVQEDSSKVTGQTSLYDSSVASSTITPVDGAVDLREEEMEASVFGLHFALDHLDASTAPPSLHLSDSSLTVTYHEENPPLPAPEGKIRRPVMTSDPGVLHHIRADVVIARGQYYWEVEVCNSSIYKIGVISVDGSNGWWLERHSLTFWAVYDGNCELLCTIPPQIKTIGIFLNIGGGTLSFHNPLTQEHLTTLPTRFSTAGVVPAMGLGQGRLRLRCGLPPPVYVFLSKSSTYREPHGNSRSEWHQEVPFQSVRKVIQKFEKLALSDSDSGLVSSFGSSCSTLASFPDVGVPGTLQSGKAGQETEP
ncbi:uncharacterized protein LOC134641577 [Pelmatolapia mariae]|uniref:uncharacterized protein LOC134641577 n=1 Tax=Pelmatolapia mariae TaxID=158779 RepID=UPI002FE5CBCE